MDNSYQRVKKFRRQLVKERKLYLQLMLKIGNIIVFSHIEKGGLDRFRIFKNNGFEIGPAYIQELSAYMAGHHKRDIQYYLDKYSKELL